MPGIDFQNTIYNPENISHQEAIQDAINTFKHRLSTLETLDIKIKIMLGTGSGIWFFSALIPASPTLLAGSALILGWFLNTRETLNPLYRQALTDLITVYDWIMQREKVSMKIKLLDNPTLNVIATLAPWIPKEQLCRWNPEDYQVDAWFGQNLSPKTKEILKNYETTDLSKTWAYRFYGKTGSFTDTKPLYKAYDDTQEKISPLFDIFTSKFGAQ
jgi:hypothetical protein